MATSRKKKLPAENKILPGENITLPKGAERPGRSRRLRPGRLFERNRGSPVQAEMLLLWNSSAARSRLLTGR
jgi:hypothetical protein